MTGSLCLFFFFKTFLLTNKHLKIDSAKSSVCINSLNGLPVPRSLTIFLFDFFASSILAIIAGITWPVTLLKLSLSPYTFVGIKHTMSIL